MSLDKLTDVPQRGRRAYRGGTLVIGGEHTDEITHVIDGRTAQPPDVCEYLIGALQIGTDDVPDAFCLYRDHVKGVAKHIMYFAGDAGALLDSDEPPFDLLSCFKECRALKSILVAHFLFASNDASQDRDRD